ncbi:MAG: hydroxysqualene dehydroxylase HpnE [Ilumatobacteraceae bacterium]
MTIDPVPDVVVVGGGLAGIAAAIRAADEGAAVTLFEHAPRLGGATWSFEHDGLTYDNGQHVFMRCCTEYRALLDRIGSSGDVELQDRMEVVVRSPDGVVDSLHRVKLPAPLHLAPSLATYRHLRLVDRLRAARTAFALRRLDPADPTLDERSFGEWLGARHTSEQALSALWDLVCLPTVNLHARDASLALATKVFRTGLLDRADGADIGWSRVPLQRLHGDAAARTLRDLRVDVRTRTRVESVTSDERGPRLTVSGEEVHARAVVVALPHDVVGRVLPREAFDTAVDLGRLERSAIVNVHLLYDRVVMEEPFFAGLHSPVQFAFDRTSSSGAPAGHQMVAISLSAADEHLPSSRHELTTLMGDELCRLLPAARTAEVVSSMVTRDPVATFRGGPRTAAHRPGTATHLPGVFLAGAWTDTGWPATMEGAVRSGVAAAQAARRHLAADHTPRGAAA